MHGQKKIYKRNVIFALTFAHYTPLIVTSLHFHDVYPHWYILQ